MRKLKRLLQFLRADFRFEAYSNGLLRGFAPRINAASNARS
jgi:hypothetical protein